MHLNLGKNGHILAASFGVAGSSKMKSLPTENNKSNVVTSEYHTNLVYYNHKVWHVNN